MQCAWFEDVYKSYSAWMNGKNLEESAIIYPKTCISINSFSFKIDNKYQRGKIFLIIQSSPFDTFF